MTTTEQPPARPAPDLAAVVAVLAERAAHHRAQAAWWDQGPKTYSSRAHVEAHDRWAAAMEEAARRLRAADDPTGGARG